MSAPAGAGIRNDRLAVFLPRDGFARDHRMPERRFRDVVMIAAERTDHDRRSLLVAARRLRRRFVLHIGMLRRGGARFGAARVRTMAFLAVRARKVMPERRNRAHLAVRTALRRTPIGLFPRRRTGRLFGDRSAVQLMPRRRDLGDLRVRAAVVRAFVEPLSRLRTRCRFYDLALVELMRVRRRERLLFHGFAALARAGIYDCTRLRTEDAVLRRSVIPQMPEREARLRPRLAAVRTDVRRNAFLRAGRRIAAEFRVRMLARRARAERKSRKQNTRAEQ